MALRDHERSAEHARRARRLRARRRRIEYRDNWGRTDPARERRAPGGHASEHPAQSD